MNGSWDEGPVGFPLEGAFEHVSPARLLLRANVDRGFHVSLQFFVAGEWRHGTSFPGYFSTAEEARDAAIANCARRVLRKAEAA